MSDPENVRMWREINRQGQSLAAMAAEADATCERVKASEIRIGTIEGWRTAHESFAVGTEARLTAAIANLSKQLEDRMTIEKSRWDKVWTVLQPLIMLAILAAIGLRGVHP